MQKLIVALGIASLLTTSALAADTAPLAPGKAAGVQKAQDTDDTVLWVVVGAAALAGIIVLATQSSSATSTSGTAA